MRIQRVDNTQFGALIRIKTPEELLAQANQMITHMSPEQRGLAAAASSSGMSTSGSGLMTLGTASNTAATTSDVIASAHFLKASGIDSFGIAPSAIARSAPYMTPETIVSSQVHPETAGTIFSGLGGWIHSHFKLFNNRPKKIPS